MGSKVFFFGKKRFHIFSPREVRSEKIIDRCNKTCQSSKRLRKYTAKKTKNVFTTQQ